MASLVSEKRVWRELTQFHFSQAQIDQMIEKQLKNAKSTGNSIDHKLTQENIEHKIDWQKLFHALRRYEKYFRRIRTNYFHNYFILFLQKVWNTRRLSILGDSRIVSILLLFILAIGRSSVYCRTVAGLPCTSQRSDR